MRPTNWAYTAFALVIACVDFCAFPVMFSVGPGRRPMVFIFVFGVIGAQIGLVASWGVFSSATFIRRITISALVGLFFYLCFVAGILTANRFIARTETVPPEVPFVVLAACPLVFFGVQLPLWSAHIWLNWKISLLNDPPSGSYLGSMKISHFILGTMAISVALAIARSTVHSLSDDADPNDFLPVFIVLPTAAAVASSVTVPPLVFLTLGTRTILTGLVGIGLWFAVAVTGAATVVFIGGGLTVGTLYAILLLGGSFTTFSYTGLLVARRSGYRLRWRRKEAVDSRNDVPQ